MEHSSAQSTRKSLISPGQTPPLPSEQDVVVRSLTVIGRRSSQSTALILALTLLEGMSAEMHSPDALFLAMARAKHNRPEYVKPDDWNGMIDKIAIYLHKNSRENPISGMF
jgi:hypothetical protein